MKGKLRSYPGERVGRTAKWPIAILPLRYSRRRYPIGIYIRIRNDGYFWGLNL